MIHLDHPVGQTFRIVSPVPLQLAGDRKPVGHDRPCVGHPHQGGVTHRLVERARGIRDHEHLIAFLESGEGWKCHADIRDNPGDKELLQAVTQGLTPQQKARAALFLGRFRDRIERHMWMNRGGPGGHGMGPGMPGMGPGMMEKGQQGMRMRGGDDDHLAIRMNGGDDLDDPPPFAFVNWHETPRLEGTAAALSCLVDAIHEGGDHWIVVGQVIATYRVDNAALPLVFFGGKYVTLGDFT